jgi:RNA polymerase sigma-70 factor, ECF subfamily
MQSSWPSSFENGLSYGLTENRGKNYNGFSTFWEDAHVTPLGSEPITALIRAWSDGDQTALERLTPLVYGELRRTARRYMRSQRQGHTLQTTALVHEAYLHLVDGKDTGWQDRGHFFAAAAQIMRRILVDLAREHASQKRGGGLQHLSHSAGFNPDVIPARGTDRSIELMTLDDALIRLEKMDGRKAKVIELRFFGGLSVEETAAALKMSPQSVMRDWRLARAWLARELRA